MTQPANANSGSPPSPFTYTGSSLDGANCTSCHAGAAVSNSGNLSLAGLPASWAPNTAYSLTLTLSAGTRYGFEITAENAGAKQGTFAAGANSVVLDGPARFLGHSAANTVVNSWAFTWTAGAAGAGTITFYMAGNAADGTGGTGGDTIHLKNYSLSERATISSLSPAFGAAGEAITLTGFSFVGTISTVSFGGVSAPCASGSNTSLSCVVPAGVAEGSLSVTVANASGVSNAQSFFAVTAAPVVTAVSPSTGSFLDGAKAVNSVVGSNFSKSAALKLTKTGQPDIVATGTTVASTASFTAATLNLSGAATGQWNVVVSNPDGQSGTLSNGYSILDLPQAPVLAGLALSSGSIRWSWTVSSGNLSGLALTRVDGSTVAALAASATQYVETGFAAATSVSRILVSTNVSGSAASNTASVATAERSLDVVPAVATILIGLDGQTRLDVPAGALSSAGQACVSGVPLTRPLTTNTTALIAAANGVLPANLRQVASSLREFILTVSSDRFTNTLGSPVTVRIPYPDADNDGNVDGMSPTVKTDGLSLYVLNESLQSWESVSGSAVDLTNKWVVGTVNHLSIFALFGAASSSDFSLLKVFPNPWRPGSGGTFDAAAVRFQNLTGAATIKIFTISGALVRRLEKGTADGNEKIWDGTDENGRKVSSGVFPFMISNAGGQKRTGRIAIIR